MKTINNQPIADIHTHILPGIDDGPKTADESLEMLLMQQKQGITDVVLTPHFLLSHGSIEDFLAKRDVSFKILMEKIKESKLPININLHLGAEVRYDPNLIYSDISKLCIGNTSYILLELAGSYPFNFEQTIQWLISKGITPILAHIERYDYLFSNQKLLEELFDLGVIFQSNASSLKSVRYARRVKKLIKQGYVRVLASDAHNTVTRLPELVKGLCAVPKFSRSLISNSLKIVENKTI
ncbi:MAG: hypothetical protein J6Q74_04155 [Clostridia bacterium]|nr:hypothetical protein [Clostridia bacterium]